MKSTIQSIRVETKVQKSERLRDEWIASAVAHLYKRGVFTPGEVGAASSALEVAVVCYESVVDWSGHFDYETYTPEETIDEELTYWN